MYLTNRSSGAYETLRNSACVHLPSQRTLRDYTHYIQASTGFSNEVEQMLMKVARVGTCPDREKCTLLLLESSSDVVYKVRDPFFQEKRDLFFLSNPPHLVKTVRNCWQSRKRTLWVRMCEICIHLWCIDVSFCIF